MISILVNESFPNVSLNRDQSENMDQIDNILESFLINTKEKYGIMTLLGMNLFDNDNNSNVNNNNNYQRTDDYGSIIN